MGYKIYTTAHDKVVHARDLLAEISEEDGKALSDYLDQWTPDAVDPAPADGAKPVRFILDMSGSLRGRPIMSLLSALRCEGDRLDAAGVPFEVLGFTTSAWRGGQSRADWVEAGRPQAPGRTSDLLHVVFKGMDEAWSDCRDLFSICLKQGFLKENIDGEALEWARSRASTDLEEACLIMVSDGTPYCDNTKALNPPSLLDKHLDQVIDALIEDGVAFQRVRMGSSWDRKVLSLREGVDIPTSTAERDLWFDRLQDIVSKRHMSEETHHPLRMGVGEAIPMNPMSHALSDAVTQATRCLAAKNDSDSSLIL